MWQEILNKFKRFPAQEKVIRLMLQRGFQINDASRVVSGRIEIPHVQIAKELDVDRRVVDTTAQAIRDDEDLWKIFKNVRSMTFLVDVATILGMGVIEITPVNAAKTGLLGDVAPILGLGVIEITPVNATKTGLLGDVASAVAKNGLSIRQAVSDDPYFVESPKLTLITEGKIPGDLVRLLMEIEGVKRVTVY